MLSEYLLGFFEFYGIRFDVASQEIIMKNGGQIRRKGNRNMGFSLIYQQAEDINVGSQAFKIRDVFNVFKNRYNFVMNYKFEPNESVLKYLINPSETDFKIYLN